MQKLSIIGITANPTEKQYAWKEALESYCDLADEVIIVDGGTEDFPVPEKVRKIRIPDPEVWTWAEHGKKLSLALGEAKGDWIIKIDLDWIFHENDLKTIRQKLEGIDAPVATFQKKTVYPFRKYVQKGAIPIAINKRYKNTIRFGKDENEYTDLTYPIWWRGKMDENDVPVGNLIRIIDWGKTGVTFWNFDYTFKTFEVAKKLFLRMSNAHRTYFGSSSFGNNEEEALEVFIRNMKGKLTRGLDLGDLSVLPKYIRGRIENIKKEEWGFDGWGLLA
jgi:hypothetical protein